jgi:hypothetical protein
MPGACYIDSRLSGRINLVDFRRWRSNVLIISYSGPILPRWRRVAKVCHFNRNRPPMMIDCDRDWSSLDEHSIYYTLLVIVSSAPLLVAWASLVAWKGGVLGNYLGRSKWTEYKERLSYIRSRSGSLRAQVLRPSRRPILRPDRRNTHGPALGANLDFGRQPEIFQLHV